MKALFAALTLVVVSSSAFAKTTTVCNGISLDQEGKERAARKVTITVVEQDNGMAIVKSDGDEIAGQVVGNKIISLATEERPRVEVISNEIPAAEEGDENTYAEIKVRLLGKNGRIERQSTGVYTCKEVK